MAQLITPDYNQLVPNLSLLGTGFEQGTRISESMANREALKAEAQASGQLAGIAQTQADKQNAIDQGIADDDRNAASDKRDADLQALMASKSDAERADLERENIELTTTSVNALGITDLTQRRLFLERKKAQYVENKRDTSNIDRALAQDDAELEKTLKMQAEQGQDISVRLNRMFSSAETPAGTAEFTSLTKDLTKEQKQEATLIKLGLSPRAVGNALQTITSQGIEQEIGKASAVIKQREKFGEMTGVSRAKMIDAGFEQITKINRGIGNIDRAAELINSGAGVGAIEKFFPSFKAASVELDNVQKSMALDVIGSVTFGALSQGELNLAKEVALPIGLDAPELIEHLKQRKEAQIKLRDYFQDQIQFLDQGGTVAGFLRSKENENAQQPAETNQADQPQANSIQDVGIIMEDENGNRARVYQDGRFEEL
jgi:hypothetical protein